MLVFETLKTKNLIFCIVIRVSARDYMVYYFSPSQYQCVQFVLLHRAPKSVIMLFHMYNSVPVQCYMPFQLPKLA